MSDDTIDESHYTEVGRFHVTEVARLFPALEAAKVRFFFDMPDFGFSDHDPVMASMGGTFGQSAELIVFIHLQDQDLFDILMKKALA